MVGAGGGRFVVEVVIAVLEIGFAFLIKKQPVEEKPRVTLEELGLSIRPYFPAVYIPVLSSYKEQVQLNGLPEWYRFGSSPRRWLTIHKVGTLMDAGGTG